MAVEVQLQVLAQMRMVELVKFHQKKCPWLLDFGPCDGGTCALRTPVAKAPFTKPKVYFSSPKQALKIQQRHIIFVFSGTFTVFFFCVCKGGGGGGGGVTMASERTVKWERSGKPQSPPISFNAI